MPRQTTFHKRLLHILRNEARMRPAGRTVLQPVARRAQLLKQRVIAFQRIRNVRLLLPIRCSDRARLRVHDRPPVIGKPERARAVNRRRRTAAHDQITAYRHSAIRLRAARCDGQRIAAVKIIAIT